MRMIALIVCDPHGSKTGFLIRTGLKQHGSSGCSSYNDCKFPVILQRQQSVLETRFLVAYLRKIRGMFRLAGLSQVSQPVMLLIT